MRYVCELGLIVLLGLALSACGGTLAPAATTGEGDLEAKGFVESADGKLRVSGRAPLFVSLKMLTAPPALPAGWELVAPAFDVTAQDRQRRPIQKLAALIKLRFDVPANRPVTVLVHTGNAWEIVPSEIDADGKLVAEVDHLTPYVAAAPVTGKSAPKITPAPKATVVTAPASAGDAQTALQNAIAALKGKPVKVTAATGYTGSLYVPLPDAWQSTLNAISASGTVYYGMYGAVNQAITAQAKSGASVGALTLLAEPKTAMPANATEARSSLTALFPGVPVAALTQARADATAYVFYSASGSTAYSAGYVTANGITLAFAMVGSGAYQPLVPKQ